MLGHLNAKLAAPALALALVAAMQSGSCGKRGGSNNTNAAGANTASANANAGSGGSINRVLGGGQTNVNQTGDSDGGGAGRVAEGVWGGDHVRLTVTASGADIEFDCAHGRMGPLKTDAQGKFSVDGNFVLERGGGITEGDKEDSRPTRYSGRVEGRQMTLTYVVKGTDEIAEPINFKLTHGNEGNRVKCL